MLRRTCKKTEMENPKQKEKKMKEIVGHGDCLQWHKASLKPLRDHSTWSTCGSKEGIASAIWSRESPASGTGAVSLRDSESCTSSGCGNTVKDRITICSMVIYLHMPAVIVVGNPSIAPRPGYVQRHVSKICHWIYS